MKALILSLLFSSVLPFKANNGFFFQTQVENNLVSSFNVIYDRAVAARFLNDADQIVYFRALESGDAIEDVVEAAGALLEGSFTLELHEIEDGRVILSQKVKL
ncbi:MAG: hypothetical protein ACKVTZ_21310 [Bacteroidia bacterium]